MMTYQPSFFEWSQFHILIPAQVVSQKQCADVLKTHQWLYRQVDVVKCLLFNLNLDPQHAQKMLGTTVCVFNPSAGRQRQ